MKKATLKVKPDAVNPHVRNIIAAFVAVCGLVVSAEGVTNWVSSAVAIGAGSGTEEDPWGDLYFAVTNLSQSNAKTFDTVVLKKGTYRMSDYLPSGVTVMTVANRNTSIGLATIMGETGKPEDVIIDCGNATSFLMAGHNTISVRGLTVTGAKCAAGEGTSGVVASAITHLSWAANDVIADCIFTNCLNVRTGESSYGYSGGTVWLQGGTVERCRFFDCGITNDAGPAYGAGVAGRDGTILVNDCLFERCWTYANQSSLPAGMSAVGATGGAACYHYGSSPLYASNCVFVACTSICSTAAHAYGGAVDFTHGSVYGCFFTNCYSSGKCGGLVGGATGSTFVDCHAATDSAGGSGGKNNLYLNNVATGAQTAETGAFSGCVFRGNKSSGEPALFSVSIPLRDTTLVISNNVFANNIGGGKGLVYFRDGGSSWDGTHDGEILMTDCLFRSNEVAGWGLLATFINDIGVEHGATVRNCLFYDLSKNVPFVFVNESESQKCHVNFENCSFLRTGDWNQPIISSNAAGYQFTHLKNCLGYNKNTKWMLPTELATMGNVTNCVFSNGAGVNTDPEYGNRVMSLAQMNLDASYRPTRKSPLVDACTNQFDAAWCASATNRKGPWDMGDGTWTELPHATFAIFGKTYEAGVVITRNNAHPRKFGSAVDIGSGEFYRKPGLTVSVY